MSSGAFSIDQLMELAGLSVSQAGIPTLILNHTNCRVETSRHTNSLLHTVYKVHPPSSGKNVLVVCGPGNNGKLCKRSVAKTPLRSAPPHLLRQPR